MSPQSKAYKWLVAVYRKLLRRLWVHMRAARRQVSRLRKDWREAAVALRTHIELLNPRYMMSVTPIGGQLSINLTTSDTQQTPAVAVDANGNSFAVWQSNHQDADGWGIFGRKFDASGNPVSGEFLVNQVQTHDQTDPSIAIDSAGDFVVTWTSTQNGHPDIYARVFNNNTTPATNEILVNAATTGNQQDSAVGMDGAGNFVVTFEASGVKDADVGVYYRAFNSAGQAAASEALVNTTISGTQNNPAIGMNSDGDFVISWTDKSTTKTNIRAQRFAPGQGNPLGGEIIVGSTGNNNQDNSSVGIDAAGNFVITFAEQLPSPNNWDISARRFDANGNPLDAGPTAVNTTITDVQGNPAIAETPDGRYFIAWTGHNQDGDHDGVFGRTFAATGVADGSDFQINTYTHGDQRDPAVGWSRGRVMVAWDGESTADGHDISAQLFVPTNVAPVLDSSKRPVLPTIAEDVGAPVGAVGALVSSLVDFSTPTGQLDNVSDADSSALGIALTAADTSHGAWYFTTDAGAHWAALGAVSVSSARLLAADANTRIYFQPAANFASTLTSAISYRAWDQTSGTAGGTGNTSVNGGATAFSAATASASLVVSPVDDAPVNTVPAAQSGPEDIGVIFSAANGNAISVADIDAGSSSVRVTLSVTGGAMTLASSNGLSFTAGDGVADASMTFSGSLAAVNNALNGMSYKPPTDASGAYSLTITTSDLGNTGSGGPLTDSDTVSITVTAVNDAPMNHLPPGQSVGGGSILLSSSVGAAISVTDVDVGSGQMQVSLSASVGTLSLATTTGLTFSSGTGTGDASMTFRGTLANINTALDGMTYQPPVVFLGTAQIQISTSDLGNSGTGGALMDTDTLDIGSSLVNTPPVNTVPSGQSVVEDGNLVFSAASGNAISVDDSTAGSSAIQVSVSVSRGVLTLPTEAGLTFSAGDGNADATMTFTGTLDDLNNALDGLFYSPPANGDSTATLTITTNDLGQSGPGGAMSDSDSVSIAVTPIADTPTVTNAVTSVNQQSAGGLVISRNAADGAEVAYFKITNIVGGQLFQSDGVTPIASGAFITYAQAHAGLRFTPITNSTVTGTFDVQASTAANNTGLGGDVVTATVVVTPPPTVIVPAAQTAPEDTDFVLSSGSGNVIEISDPALDSSDSDTVTVSTNHGTLTLPTAAGMTFLTGDGVSDATMSFSGTLAAINAALDGLTFTPAQDFTGAATVSVGVTDSTHAGLGTLTGSGSATVAVAAVNDAPVNRTPGQQTVNEGQSLLFSSATGNAIFVSDVDAGGAVIQVDLAAIGGKLKLAQTTGLTFLVGNGVADVNASFTGTIANINAALDGLRFNIGAHYNGVASVQITSNDLGNSGAGGAQSSAATVGVTVDPVNDPPTITDPGPQSMMGPRSVVFSAAHSNAIVVDDVDAGGAAEQIAVTVVGGTVTLSGTSGLTFQSGSGVASAVTTFHGTLAALNAALEGMAFTPSDGFSGAASIHITVDDLGNSGTGGDQSASLTVPIAVAPSTAGITVFPTSGLTTSESGATDSFSIVLNEQPTADVTVDLTSSDPSEGAPSAASVTFTPATWNVPQTVTVTGVDDLLDDGDIAYAIETGAAQSSDPAYARLNAADVPVVNLDDADPPTVEMSSGDTEYDESAAPVAVDAGLNLPIGDALDSATVNITSGYVPGQDELRFESRAGITGQWDSATGQLTLTGHALAADYQAVLRSVTFVNTSQDPDTTDRQVDVTVADASVTSAPATRRVRVIAENTPPVTNIPENQKTPFEKPITFSSATANPISVADADVRGAFVQVTLAAKKGSITLGPVDGLNFTMGTGTNNTLIQFTGTVPVVNAALDGMTFTPARGFSGQATLRVTINDGGNFGRGGAKITEGVVAIAVGQKAEPALDLPSVPAAPPVNTPIAPPPDFIPPGNRDDDGSAPNARGGVATPQVGAAMRMTGHAPSAAHPQPASGPMMPAPAPKAAAAEASTNSRSSSSAPAKVNAIRPNAQAPVHSDSAAAALNGTQSISASASAAATPAVLRTDSKMWKALDKLKESLKDDQEREVRVVAGTASFVVGGLSIIYFIWAVRAGSVLSSLLSSVPVWNAVDPLPILDDLPGRKRRTSSDESDDDGLETLVTGEAA